MFLANIGKLFAAAIRLGYGKGCCWFCYRDRKRLQDQYVADHNGDYSHRVGDPAPDGFRYWPQAIYLV